MAENNNFKDIDNFEASEDLKKKSLTNTKGSISTVQSFFNILDLYVTKFFDTFIHSVKDESEKTGLASGIGLLSHDDKEQPDENKEDDDENPIE